MNVKVVGGIDDDKIFAALRSGNVPDIVSSFMSSNVGIFCPSGGWVDLAPYLKKDHINVNIFPATSRYYTQYKGTRCALPLLVDSTGLYYNKTLFKKAGITRPPRTLSELSADAKKLTVRNKRRLAEDRRLRPEHELLHGWLRQRRVRLPAADRRQLLRQERQVEPRQGSRRGQVSSAGKSG